MFNLKLKDFKFSLSDFKLKSLLDINYYKSTCNIMVVIFIIILLFFLTFAIKTRKRYLNIKNTLGEMNNTSIEAFSNMDQENQQDIMDKLNIDETDVEIVKNKNKNENKNKKAAVRAAAFKPLYEIDDGSSEDGEVFFFRQLRHFSRFLHFSMENCEIFY